MLLCALGDPAFLSEWYPILWIATNVFIHSAVDGHLYCFQLGAIRSKTAVDIHVHVLMWTCFHYIWAQT